MARVRLYLKQLFPSHVYRFLRPDGTVGTIRGLRLIAYVRLVGLVRTGPDGERAAFPDCVVDTGAYLSIVPQDVWQEFLPGVVTPLPFHPSMPAHLRSLTIAGGTFPYDLGELTIPLRDPSGSHLDVRVVAKFTRDGGRLNIPLTLGLSGGVLDGRVLRAYPDPATAFGQAWVLEDAGGP